jgi:TolB-like protein
VSHEASNCNHAASPRTDLTCGIPFGPLIKRRTLLASAMVPLRSFLVFAPPLSPAFADKGPRGRRPQKLERHQQEECPGDRPCCAALSVRGAVTEHRVQRRLAAILAADVVGYSALLQRAEEATYAEFERLKGELIAPSLSRHEGRLIKTTGDGALAEFASPLAAMRCALEIQDCLALGGSLLRLRVGLNLGDVIVGQDGDLYGEGITIAVRLEGIADPGGILISEKVYSEVEGKLDVGFEDRGEQQLKNISKPVRAYAVSTGADSAPINKLGAALSLPDKPSIAVLPFQNLTSDPEQEFFADGMVEEIITALSRFKELFVIARNSSFTYKGRAVEVKQVGRELGVRYVLEGSVRKAANRVRITGDNSSMPPLVHTFGPTGLTAGSATSSICRIK